MAGHQQVGITWKLDSPFSISPQSVVLSPGESHKFMVSFLPVEACSYDAHAVCQLDNGSSVPVNVSTMQIAEDCASRSYTMFKYNMMTIHNTMSIAADLWHWQVPLPVN